MQTKPANDPALNGTVDHATSSTKKVKTLSPAQTYPSVLERKLLPVSVAKQLRSTTHGFHLGYDRSHGCHIQLGGVRWKKLAASDSHHSTCNYNQLCNQFPPGKLVK